MREAMTPGPTSADARNTVWLPAALTVLAGLVVRGHTLRWQIFSDDEWHALKSAGGKS